MLKKITANLRVGKHSETLLINQISQLREENNKKVYKLGFGQSPFPVPKAISRALSKAAHHKEYMSVQGYLPLREAICDFHGTLENKQWDTEQIIIAPGSKILIYCVMAAFSNARILLPGPSWVSYEPQAKLAGHEVDWLMTNFEQQWKLTAESLDNHCQSLEDTNQPLVLIFNYPNNPSGQSYSRAELKSLAIVMKKHNIIVVADEIYSLLSFKPKYSTLEEFYPEGCIVSSGLSKWCGAGGWRLGFHHIPKQLGEDFFQAMIGVASETYSCAPSPVQIAAVEAYKNNTLAKQFLKKQISMLKEVNEFCARELRKAKIKVHDADGGFYLFPDFDLYRKKLSMKAIETSEQLTNIIMDQTGVALLPGSAFGMPSDSLTARLAFVDFDGEQVNDEDLAKFDFEKIKEGINKLCIWLETL